MLPLLLLGAKAALFQTWEVGKSDRAFDFRYRNNSRTTYQNYGWRVQLRTNTTNPNDSNSNMTYTALAKNKGIIEEEGLKLEPRFDQSLGENYMRIIFDLTNNGDEAKIFDLGIYADISIGEDDKATVKALTNGIGFTMESTIEGVEKGDVITLLVRDRYDVTNVDCLYYGKYDSDNSLIGRNMEELNPLVGVDSIFEIGWINREILPHSKQSFNVLLVIGKYTRIPPIIKLDDLETFRIKGDTVTVTGEYSSIYNDSIITLKYKYGDTDTEHTVEQHSVKENGSQKHFSFDFIAGPERTKNLIVWVEDEDHRKSKEVSKEITANVLPTISFAKEPVKTCLIGDEIPFEIQVNDDKSAKITYEFGGKKFEEEKFTILENTPQTKKFTLNTKELDEGKYKLAITAVDNDNCKCKSDISFEIQVNNHPRPIFESGPNVTYPLKIEPGSQVSISMKVKNPSTINYTFKAEINGEIYEFVIPPTENNEATYYSFNITIPKKSENADNKVVIFIMDNRNKEVSKIEKPNDKKEQTEEEDHSKPEGNTTSGGDNATEHDAKKKKKQIYMIIGAAVGAVALITLVSLLIFFLAAGKRNEEEEEENEKDQYIDAVDINEETVISAEDGRSAINSQKVFTLDVENGNEFTQEEFVL